MFRRSQYTALATLLALGASQPAQAGGELPPSAQALIPPSWSVEAPDGALSTARWADAYGGQGLLSLLGMIDQHADVAQADAQVTQASGQKLQAASGLLPSVSASGSWQTGTPNAAFAAVSDNSMDVYSASADLSLPLTLWSAIPEQRAANASMRGAEADREDAYADAALAVAAAVLDVTQAQLALQIVEDQLRVETELLTLTEASYANGDGSGVDVLQQRQQLASVRQDLPDARAELGRTQRALATLLRIPVDALPALPEALPQPQVPALPSPSELIRSDPGVQSALESWSAQDYQHRAAWAGLAPDLSLTASTGVRYTEDVDTELTPTWSVGLQVSVPIFSGGSTAGQIRERSGAERQALVTLEQAISDLVRDVEDASATWEQAGLARSSAEESAQLAEDALVASRASYAAGTETYNTVLTAAQSVWTARQSTLQAQRDHVDAALSLIDVVRGSWADAPQETP